jgi:hypothetical protein
MESMEAGGVVYNARRVWSLDGVVYYVRRVWSPEG